MANEQYRPSPAGDLGHLAEAFLLEFGVADGENFVNDEDLGLEMRSDGKAEAHRHARGIALDRRVEEFLDLGESDDLVEFAADLGARHAKNRADQVDVLAAG